MRCSKESVQESEPGYRGEGKFLEELSKTQSEGTDRLLEFDLSAELKHGIAVSNLVYALATELGLPMSSAMTLP